MSSSTATATTRPRRRSCSDWRKRQIAALEGPVADAVDGRRSTITDDEIRESLESAQLKLQRERGTDVTIFSPRAVGDGAPHRRRRRPACDWTRALQRPDPPRLRSSTRRTSSASASCRSRRACRRRTASPSSSAASTSSASSAATSIPIRPAATGPTPPLTDRYWYPLYEKMVELDVPAMVHVSASCNPNFHATGAHYINADTTAFMQFIAGRPVQGLPDAALHHPARRRRGALPLGPLPRPGAGHASGRRSTST